jgi:hypothetical protein
LAAHVANPNQLTVSLALKGRFYIFNTIADDIKFGRLK